MARHGLHRRAPQLPNPPSGAGFGSIPSSIIASATGPANSDAPVSLATSAPALTVITTTQELIVSVTGGSGFSTETTVFASTITDPAQFSSLSAAEAQSTQKSSRTSSSTPSATSSTASHKSTSNWSTLVPAIVVPVVVVLLAAFGAFWFFMRRRHHRELKNAEFIMAGKGEKLSSRTNSSRSAATGTTAVEKSAPMVVVSEFRPPQSSHASGPKYSMEDIGVARPLTPRDGTGPGSRPRTPNDRYGPSSRDPRTYQNFSGPRPSTARDRRPPPSRSGESQGRSRSNSSPAKRGPPPSAYHHGPPPGRPSPDLRGGPSPVPRSGPGPSPIPNSGAFPSARGLPTNPRPAPAPPRMHGPSPTLDHTARAAPPAHLTTPGAFNGGSAISQYSPIVKETPNIGPTISGAFVPTPVAATSKPKSSDGSQPPPLNTNNLTSVNTSRSMSPTSPTGNFLTEENMRIARLANSSRLGFFNTSATSPSAGQTLDTALANQQKSPSSKPGANPTGTAAGHSPAAASNPSPKLPPPATRSQLIPSDSPKDERKAPYNYNYFSQSKTASPTTSYHPGHGQRRQHDDDEDSNVSDLGEYEDIDAKSDISSLNEFERFEFDGRNGSQRGSGSVRGLGFR